MGGREAVTKVEQGLLGSEPDSRRAGLVHSSGRSAWGSPSTYDYIGVLGEF